MELPCKALLAAVQGGVPAEARDTLLRRFCLSPCEELSALFREFRLFVSFLHGQMAGKVRRRFPLSGGQEEERRAGEIGGFTLRTLGSRRVHTARSLTFHRGRPALLTATLCSSIPAWTWRTRLTRGCKPHSRASRPKRTTLSSHLTRHFGERRRLEPPRLRRGQAVAVAIMVPVALRQRLQSRPMRTAHSPRPWAQATATRMGWTVAQTEAVCQYPLPPRI